MNLIPRYFFGSCPAIGAGAMPDAQERPQEHWRRPLHVVRPLEDRDILVQVLLVHTAERPQMVSQPRPHPLQGVVVHLADTIAIVVPRPFADRVAHRGVTP